MSKLLPDTASAFMSFSLASEDIEQATNVSPLFLAYLQNKISAYAEAVVNSKLPYSADPTQQVTAILAHEKLKNYVQAYQELLSELLQNQPKGF